MHVTSPGRYGGCKEDKDEQSSLPRCGMEFHDVYQAKLDWAGNMNAAQNKTTVPENKKALQTKCFKV